MSDVNDQNQGTEAPKDAPQAEASEGTATQGSAETSPSTPPTPPPPDPVATLTVERDKFRDQLVRTLADFDNFRKRTRREAEDAPKRGKEDLLRELLPVFDNLERAATAAQTATDPKSVADGVQMVLKLFRDTVTRVGGVRLESVGQPFDPNLHEAISQMESAEHPAGVVMMEMVPGYQFGDRLLRPAMVVVSKGPGPAAAPAEGNGA